MINVDRIERVKRKALEYDFLSGCSQSVLGAIQEEFAIGNIDSFKAATVLSGGVVRTGETCGAIIGALLALGLVIGRERMEDFDAYQGAMKVASKVRDKFMKELKTQFDFQEELESTLCRHIQEKIYGRSFNLADDRERQAFLDAGGHGETGCPKVCGIAAQVVAEKIMELE
ncbi:MAG: C-GCAxxG-C-C family protein [Dehalococcoidales bacterium]